MTETDTGRGEEGASPGLESVVSFIEGAPESAAALVLYALASTLEYERAGCLFKLDKLKGLDENQRALAYVLIETMARGRVGSREWKAAKDRMDRAVRGD